jgi:PIN domain
MIRLLPGVSPALTADILYDAARDLEDVQGRAGDAIALFNGYFGWAGRKMRVLVDRILPAEIDRLITTPRHWALSTLDLVQPGGTIRDFMEAQITETLGRLRAEVAAIRHELARWDGGKAVAAVLDTNVLLDLLDEIETMDWNGMLDVRPPTSIVLAVPMAVIDELDVLKRDNKQEPKDSKRPPLRNRASLAIRRLESWLSEPGAVVDFGHIKCHGPVSSPLRLALINQDLGHVPIPHTDSEIIDRALSLAGFADDVRIVSFDTGMILRARQAGLNPCRPPVRPA